MQNNPYNFEALKKQLHLQKRHEFDLDTCVDWERAIDLERFFLPIDQQAIAFPGADADQQRVISQLMGLVVNHTIAEMEDVADKLKGVAWQAVLDDYPVGPELEDLGTQFFAEEKKHAEMFRRYYHKFCSQQDMDPEQLKEILPLAYGSKFQRAIRRNAENGGHAFWWVVALVEEVAVGIYQQLYKFRNQIDPLYYEIQRCHFEEESRHTNYAFMMLEVIRQKNIHQGRRWNLRVDLVYSELFSTGWVFAELEKVFNADKLKHEHEFFYELSECLPLLRKIPLHKLAYMMFSSAPYISAMLNPRFHRLTSKTADAHKALILPYPEPQKLPTSVTIGDVWSEAS